MSSHSVDHEAPAILAEVHPAIIPRAELVGHGRDFHWITEKICGIVEGKTPVWWWWCFGAAAFVASFTVAGLIYLVSTGVGVWGHANPVNWAWDIVNFVFWIGIGHAGTLISAILCLLRQKWRTSINRPAEAMTIFAVVCAAIFPVFHVGRIWFAVMPGYLLSGRIFVRLWSGTCSQSLHTVRFPCSSGTSVCFPIWARCATASRRLAIC
jgi:molybdopterin-containing oxidoreductase family membrane subunit